MPQAFLLTRQWRDTREGVVLDFWWATDNGPCWTQVTGQEVVFFIAREQAAQISALLRGLRDWRMADVELKTFRNQWVCALYFKQHRLARDAQTLLDQARICYWESDIRPTERYLMERFITAAADLESTDTRSPLINPRLVPVSEPLWRPALRMLSLDIETSMDATQLYSIGIWCEQAKIVLMVGEGQDTESVRFCSDERTCLEAFFVCIEQLDPDIVIGWNLVQFDLLVLEKLCQRLNISLRLGRAGQSIHWRHEEGDGGRSFVVIPGRVALDGIDLLKAANPRFETYALQHVAEELLGEGKLLSGSDRGGDITHLFHNDKLALAQYNLRDCELAWSIFTSQHLLEFAMERSQLTGLLLDRVGGSVAAFEYLYLPRLHRRGYIAPNLGELESDVFSPGGYVMSSRPGIYDNVLVLDFKSLYPSIMRSFLVDPCAFWIAQHQQLDEAHTAPGFNGASFAREGHILPQLIEQLSAARDRAKQHRNEPLSYAIKIIMNSFYGVLGSTGCRFFDPRISSSITLRGHDIIQRSRDWIEQQGYTVIYGDTDSLFVWLENNCLGHAPKSPQQCNSIGVRLARELNAWWQETLQQDYQLNSALEIQYETHYLRFLMPTIRGSELGTKKRYAGLIDVNGQREMIFKGLENVRTDWTQLAKQFQADLYRKVFDGEDYVEYVRTATTAVLAGERDDDLIYRKRLRRQLHEYQKNVPPHVQAARKYVQWTGERLRRGDWISYVMTINGPEPLGTYEVDWSLRQSPVDYQHYIDKQLTPVADSILHFLNKSLNELVDHQLSLFGADMPASR
ncbi:DNA polymerase II [Cellvibrio japonicus]|uniref:DNA polymerase n=1 Tax=Cellvibrio japonicus (strain Ueda107) TaxID=498211 RepID=B3PC72_CELJU|nr:DNA polymerase II [Cellvibrio japonicus]ACE83473.1 DNA polymerase II [Cellvibrio japonicus Ueda107]QEI13213.1 DNA polymerase II [Cellvibrio japonicus]QEI16787.1 DNA polymerase II [Cellvibrio japonicus]QEI20365.1 DNA polymerase II [Cellvibrio japonicus]